MRVTVGVKRAMSYIMYLRISFRATFVSPLHIYMFPTAHVSLWANGCCRQLSNEKDLVSL